MPQGCGEQPGSVLKEKPLIPQEIMQIQQLNEKTDTPPHPWPPCRLACPVHADVCRYLRLIATGEFAAALEVIRERLPFAAVCGRICNHPCEANCRRRDLEGAVAIRELKRFVAEDPDNDTTPTPNPEQRQGKRVAIIGSGPAGLSAALELARWGYRPTVFERDKQAGGIPGSAIPGYRLPHEALARDIRWILAHGIGLQTGVRIGEKITINKLHRQGYAAVVIAVGLSSSRLLPIAGSKAPGVYGALDFLRGLAAGRTLKLGTEILVIGGGNVACDVARSAVRLGGTKVKMLCLESEAEMPALPEEISEAREEGVEIITRRAPMEILTTGEKVTGLRHRRVSRVFNEEGQFAPEFDDRDQKSSPGDTVIFAIGQALDPDFIKDSGLQLDQRGRLPVDPQTHQSEIPWIFAAGEAASPPGTVVQACAHGQQTARAVDQFLRGVDITPTHQLPPAIQRLEPETAAAIAPRPRVALPLRKPEERIDDFSPFVGGLNQEQAVSEAQRCLECGSGATVTPERCVKCLNCVRLCPYQAPHINAVAAIKRERCLACGICYSACPTGAIEMDDGGPEELAATVARELARLPHQELKGVVYLCARTFPAENSNGRSPKAMISSDCLLQIRLTNPGTLDQQQLLRTLESGADCVLVALPPKTEEPHPGVTHRMGQQIKSLRQDLALLGLNPEKIQLLELSRSQAPQLQQLLHSAIRAAMPKP